MTFYSQRFRKASTRSKYARGLALDAHPRSRWALQSPDFTDHAPDQRPERIDHVAAEVADDVGQRALRHWLTEAAHASGEEHEAALGIAKEIAAMIDVPWADVMSEAA